MGNGSRSTEKGEMVADARELAAELQDEGAHEAGGLLERLATYVEHGGVQGSAQKVGQQLVQRLGLPTAAAVVNELNRPRARSQEESTERPAWSRRLPPRSKSPACSHRMAAQTPERPSRGPIQDDTVQQEREEQHTSERPVYRLSSSSSRPSKLSPLPNQFVSSPVKVAHRSYRRSPGRSRAGMPPRAETAPGQHGRPETPLLETIQRGEQQRCKTAQSASSWTTGKGSMIEGEMGPRNGVGSITGATTIQISEW